MRRRAYPERGLRVGEGIRPFQAIQPYQYIEAIFTWERWWGISWSVFFIIFLLPSKNEIWMLEANVNLPSSYTNISGCSFFLLNSLIGRKTIISYKNGVLFISRDSKLKGFTE